VHRSPEAGPPALAGSTDLFLAALAGALTGLAFPKWGLWPLAWVGLAPLIIALRGATPRRGFLLGYVFGLVHFVIILYWIAYVTTTYGGMSWLAGSGVTTLLVIYLSIYPGLFGLGLAWSVGRGIPRWVAAAPLWVALEYLRGILLTGFPWAELGASQYTWVRFIQAADLGGVALLSFVVVLVNGALADAWCKCSLRSLIPGVAALIAVALTLTYGDLRLRQVEALIVRAPKLSVVVAQGNIEQGVKWQEGYQLEAVRVYGELSAEAAKAKPDIIVWPETALPFFFLNEQRFTPTVLAMAKGLGSHVLLGCPAAESREDGDAFFNRAYLLSPAGQPVGKYDKVHLVPWGEYVPLQRYMPFLGKAVEAVGNFEAGDKGQCMDMAGRVPARIGVLICFESIFADLGREAVRHGATLLAVITNDAWFGTTSAPYQHFSMAVLRAVEARRSVVRAANTGVSGFIGPDGRVMAATNLFERVQMGHEVPLLGTETIYIKFGDVFAWACLAAAGGLVVLASLRRVS
jgi:apolipoprotein N-acyltransferase